MARCMTKRDIKTATENTDVYLHIAAGWRHKESQDKGLGNHWNISKEARYMISD